MSFTVCVELPASLSLLAKAPREVALRLEDAVTQCAILDALEQAYPALRGTIRDRRSKRRRPFIRFFACQQDFSDAAPDAPLPEAVAKGEEKFIIVGAIAGG